MYLYKYIYIYIYISNEKGNKEIGAQKALILSLAHR